MQTAHVSRAIGPTETNMSTHHFTVKVGFYTSCITAPLFFGKNQEEEGNIKQREVSLGAVGGLAPVPDVPQSFSWMKERV